MKPSSSPSVGMRCCRSMIASWHADLHLIEDQQPSAK
jgi:hypothetical protein